MSTTVVRPRNPLQPLAKLVSVAFRVTVLATALHVIWALDGNGPVFGWGGGDNAGSARGVCMKATTGLLQLTGAGLSRAGMAAGTGVSWTMSSVCAARPSTGESLVAAVTQLPTTLLGLVAFFLAARLVAVAARDGIYTQRIARQLLILGWWLLAGELAATVIEAFARLSLLSDLVTWNVDWTQWFVAWYVSWPLVLIGLSLITFARVMRLGVTMREDLDGTI